MSLYKNIKTIRTNKGMTQAELAEVLHVTIRTIQNYESGNREPNIDTLTKIADVLGVSTDELTGKKKVVYDLTNPKIRETLSKIPKEDLLNRLEQKIKNIQQNAADAIVDIGIFAGLEDEMQILKVATDEQIEIILNNLGRHLKFELFELKNNIENK